VSWKEFLKPDWRKILIYAAIFGGIFTLPLIIFFPPACSLDVECTQAFFSAFRVTLFSTIPVYFVSCFYVWIYNFYKKKLT